MCVADASGRFLIGAPRGVQASAAASRWAPPKTHCSRYTPQHHANPNKGKDCGILTGRASELLKRMSTDDEVESKEDLSLELVAHLGPEGRCCLVGPSRPQEQEKEETATGLPCVCFDDTR